MTASHLEFRECADCYFRRGSRCLSSDAAADRRGPERDSGPRHPGPRKASGCSWFLRASLRFAFFPSLWDADIPPVAPHRTERRG